MPTRSALTLTDALTKDGGRPVTASPDATLSTQAAFVRSLVDEVERHHPSSRLVVALREQLGDELARLAELLIGDASVSPNPAREGAPFAARPLDVLVVDDEADARRAAVTALRRMRHVCRAAADGEEALREYDRQPADVVLSDWSMPGMSGLDLCTTLKRREPRPYVILVTAFHENARLLEGERRGVDDFLHKPIDLEELEVRLLAAGRLLRAVRAIHELNERLRERLERPMG
jgi:CheY-like chemotaxis protein